MSHTSRWSKTPFHLSQGYHHFSFSSYMWPHEDDVCPLPSAKWGDKRLSLLIDELACQIVLPRNGLLPHYSPQVLRSVPERHSEGIPPDGKSFKQSVCHPFQAEEMARVRTYMDSQVAVNGLTRSVPGGRKIWKLRIRRSMDSPQGVDSHCEDVCDLCWHPPESIHHGSDTKQPSRLND